MKVDEDISFAKLKMLWFVNLDYKAGMHHGGNLRFFNYAKELASRGHDVYFVVHRKKVDDVVARKKCLDDLKQQGTITDYFEIDYEYPRPRGKLSHIVTYPMLANHLLRKYQVSTISTLKDIIADKQINFCLFSDRHLLFVLPAINQDVRTVIDWVDCYVLYHIRQIAVSLKKRQLTGLPKSVRYLIDAFAQESYYGKRCAMNLVVSPVDKQYLDVINRVTDRNSVLLNGVEVKNPRDGADKIKNRIIFTGNMNFPPNHEAAIWFIDHVLPLILKRKSDVKFVVAGANPLEDLLGRRNSNIEVAGYVEGMGQEIAKSELYVAPLVSGGGFKNKVVEAIANGTFVVATSMAVEFLGPDVQKQLLVADAPEAMAQHVLAFLDNPQEFETRLETLKNLFSNEFTWANRTNELISIARGTPAYDVQDALILKTSVRH
ncbi:MAG: glycosyltransferase [Pyrinomonadaceae bacterium]|nr:glycosyltransferase [Pyrinomonadaceae bacterium]